MDNVYEDVSGSVRLEVLNGMTAALVHIGLVNTDLKPGEKRQGWIVRPYHSYETDLPALREQDWALEMEQGKEEWRDLLGRACKLSIPDVGVSNAYLARLLDLFIMREPLADGRIVAVPGTEGYRAGNSGEPLIVAVALDQNGLHKESVDFESEATVLPNGCGLRWNAPRGTMKFCATIGT